MEISILKMSEFEDACQKAGQVPVTVGALNSPDMVYESELVTVI